MSKWLTNHWYCAMYSNLLPRGGVEARTILGESIAVFRGQDGLVRAIEDRCAHRWVPLSIGKQVGTDRIQCKYHGLEYDGTGHCVHNPHGQGNIPASQKLKTYPVHEYCGIVWLWMGWKEADLSLLPDLSSFLPDSPHALLDPGAIKIDIPFELMIDNVLDLSHVALVHDGILGTIDSLVGETSFERKGDLVTALRLTRNIVPPEYFRLIYNGDDSPVDIWNNVSWKAPTHLMLDVGCTRPGGTREEGTSILAQHIITPMTETSCMYHFLGCRVNPPKRTAEETKEIHAQLATLRRFAFKEQDEPIIAAQWSVIRQKGNFRPSPLKGIDEAAIMWRREYDRLVADDEAARRPAAEATATTATA